MRWHMVLRCLRCLFLGEMKFTPTFYPPPSRGRGWGCLCEDVVTPTLPSPIRGGGDFDLIFPSPLREGMSFSPPPLSSPVRG